jgi:hypothetical protein
MSRPGVGGISAQIRPLIVDKASEVREVSWSRRFDQSMRCSRAVVYGEQSRLRGRSVCQSPSCGWLARAPQARLFGHARSVAQSLCHRARAERPNGYGGGKTAYADEIRFVPVPAVAGAS